MTIKIEPIAAADAEGGYKIRNQVAELVGERPFFLVVANGSDAGDVYSNMKDQARMLALCEELVAQLRELKFEPGTPVATIREVPEVAARSVRGGCLPCAASAQGEAPPGRAFLQGFLNGLAMTALSPHQMGAQLASLCDEHRKESAVVLTFIARLNGVPIEVLLDRLDAIYGVKVNVSTSPPARPPS